MGTTPTTPAPAPAASTGSAAATIFKSVGAILAGGALTFLAGLQQGTSAKQAGIAAGAAALATVIAYLTKSPNQ